MARDVLVEHNNLLYVMSEDTNYSRPILVRSYRRVRYEGTASRFKRDYGEDRIGQSLTWSRVREAYQDESKLFYDLPQGGKTRPEFTEETPFECPKVRRGIETRYRDGRWQKLLKSGWVSV